MTVTVQDVMRQMRNYFIASTLTGTFTVADGIIDLAPPLAPGAWVAIEGSGSLDGVHQLDENGKLPDAADGSWRGLLHLLSPTADFLRLCRDIRDWADKHPDDTLLTEKFGSYSRSQSSSAWEKVFERRLRPYLRMFPEVKG